MPLYYYYLLKNCALPLSFYPFNLIVFSSWVTFSLGSSWLFLLSTLMLVNFFYVGIKYLASMLLSLQNRIFMFQFLTMIWTANFLDKNSTLF